ncbi:MAG: glycoside hydrolase family 32 protein [Butyricicoccus sp.]
MSNALFRDLKRLVAAEETRERSRIAADPHRQGYHLMPPVGWLNDPNGLCYFRGNYHVFYQYGPLDPNGGVKMWGHYRSADLLHWKQCPVMLYPDQPYDLHGVYSGSAFVEDDTLYLYYTGNVKYEGDYDYVRTGRGHNTCLAVSSDGETADSKQLLMDNAAYPAGLTCHVRDPKVWKEGDSYYMVQGARTLEDKGEVLVFTSADRIHWTHNDTLTTPEPFGYMWECPDRFALGGLDVLSVSPQGLTQQGDCFQNIYACGYFPDAQHTDPAAFIEWDKGFDFYAPQTFVSPDGRRILIGWMGMPDADYGNPTAARGWQHCLTVPCVLSVRDGRILRNPVHELEALRGEEHVYETGETRQMDAGEKFDLVWTPEGEEIRLVIRDCAVLEWKENTLTLSFRKGGAGRTVRRAAVDALREVRILGDASSVEIFVNGGETVLSSRYYPDAGNGSLHVEAGGGRARVWAMQAMEVR